MKKLSFILASIFLLAACQASTTKEEKSLGERMVEFILDLVGDEPKAINDELVRDDI